MPTALQAMAVVRRFLLYTAAIARYEEVSSFPECDSIANWLNRSFRRLASLP